MGINFPWQEILNEPAGEAVRQGGEIARRAFCELRRDYPYLFDAANQAAAATSLQTALTSRALWDRVCRDVPLSAPQTAVVGGQCPVLYRVRMFLTNPANGTSVGSSLRNNVQGPLRSVTAEEFPGTIPGRSSYRITIVDALGNNLVDSVAADSTVRNARRQILIDRMDGLPDNCGNRDPVGITIPPVPPVLPPTIVIPQGDYPAVEVNVEYPTYETIDWPDFNFEPDIVIEPYRYRANPWGLDIDYQPRASFVPPVPVVLDPVVIGTIGEILTTVLLSAPVITEVLELILGQDVNLDEIERLIRCCACGENDVLSGASLFSNSEGGTYTLPSGTISIQVSLLEPVSDRTPVQRGSGSSPDVLFWGWYALGGVDGAFGERIQLSFQQTSIVIPENTTSLLFSASYGNTASGSALILTRDCS